MTTNQFRILCITRSPVDTSAFNQIKIDLTSMPLSISDIMNSIKNSPVTLERVLSDYKDILLSFTTEGITCGPALLGVKPEQTVYIYAYDSAYDPDPQLYDFSQYKQWTAEPKNWSTPLEVLPNRVQSKEFSIQVELFDFLSTSQIISLPLNLHLIEIEARIPDMATLEIHGDYMRNCLVMGCAVGIKAQKQLPDNSVEEFVSDSWLAFPVLMPPPMATLSTWSETNYQVTVSDSNFFGRLTDSPNVSNEDEDFGQVRWYSLDKLTDFIQLDLIHGFSENPDWGFSKDSITLPGPLTDRLMKLRHAGIRILPSGWTDNSAEFFLPDDSYHPGQPQPGVAVIWRDDIPSKPIICFKMLRYLEQLAARLWQPVLPALGTGTTQVIDIPIPVGNVIRLSVKQVEDGLNNLLAQLLDQKPDTLLNEKIDLSVRFAFLSEANGSTSTYSDDRIKLPDGAPRFIGSDLASLEFINKSGQNAIGAITNMHEFQFFPRITDLELDDFESGAFNVQLYVQITGKLHLKLLGHDEYLDLDADPIEIAIGPTIQFHPEPLRVPTVAIFFNQEDYFGNPLVAIQGGTGIFGVREVHVDANSSSELNKKRIDLVNALGIVNAALETIRFLGIIDSPSITMAINIIDRLAGLGAAVIDSHGKIANVTDCVIENRLVGNHNFNDEIKSVILIGAPHCFTSTMVNCYEHSLRLDNHGECLSLGLPGISVIAGIPRLSQIDPAGTTYNFTIPGIGTSISYPVPCVHDAGTWPNLHERGSDFNNCLTGIVFDPLRVPGT